MWPNVQMNEVFHHRAAVSVPCHQQEELWMGVCGFEVKMRLTISLSCLNWPQLFANMHSIHWCCCCLLETGTPLWENMNEELYFFGVRRHLRYWPIYGQVQVSWVLLFYELPRWFASYPYSSDSLTVLKETFAPVLNNHHLAQMMISMCSHSCTMYLYSEKTAWPWSVVNQWSGWMLSPCSVVCIMNAPVVSAHTLECDTGARKVMWSHRSCLVISCLPHLKTVHNLVVYHTITFLI